MSETPKENQTEKKKGGSKMIIVVILVVVLLGGAGGGFYVWRSKAAAATEENAKDTKSKKSKKAAAAEEDEETASEDGEKTDKKSDGKNSDAALLKAALPEDESVKHVIELQPFIINLADTEQARYLRLSVSLGVGGEEGEAASEKPDQLFITRVRNAMLAVLSNKKSDDVLSVEGKTKLRKELLKAAQAASEKPAVEAIYITDFIVQL